MLLIRLVLNVIKCGALVFIAEPLSWQNQFAGSSWTLETVKCENGCHLIWLFYPLQKMMLSENHLRCLELSRRLPLQAWSWDVCQTFEESGRRKKHKTLWSTWLSMSPSSAVKHILLQPRWRVLMYCKFVSVCSAAWWLVFPAVQAIFTYWIWLIWRIATVRFSVTTEIQVTYVIPVT